MDKRTKSTKRIGGILANMSPKLILKIVIIAASVGAAAALLVLYNKHSFKNINLYIKNNKEWMDSQYGK